MGSRTIWRRVTDAPDDDAAWADFRRHYLTPVYDWARRRVGEAAAEDVAAAVFVKLYQRVRHGAGPAVAPGEGGSYRGYVATVVRAAAADHFAEEQKLRPRPAPDGALEALASAPALDELADGVGEFAGYEEQLGALAAAYRAAVAGLKASPHYADRSFRVFLRVAGARRPGAAAELDRESGWSRGMASKHARNVRDRLIALMGLPPDEKRSADIVTLMVLYYGDPS